MPHYRRLDWQLQALGTTLPEFGGNLLDLLDADDMQAHVGRALRAESQLARAKLAGLRKLTSSRQLGR